ncbi:hypothetical protein BAY61_16530 [Prauserella marina]|uniref:Uncharacterized protein n=1 Tax=Prauserella marina TaxID=530584 RepID=A0A222VQZ9_9PSEU|nr:hypothetical protein [Prauserella marina]ASR36346.1 hypothetical protein BAY61_16530 [Prauserella marina]PWV77136.1 hypothetical protein DES30_105353 [Prauserella marina]SDD05266.1 hypothetical protein SAMN05421630_105354 [Prauserella marina]
MTGDERRRQRYALPGGEPTDDDLRLDAELTRAELAETAAAVLRKANVADRVRDTAEDRLRLVRGKTVALAERARASAGSVSARSTLVVGGLFVVVVLVVRIRRRRADSA